MAREKLKILSDHHGNGNASDSNLIKAPKIRTNSSKSKQLMKLAIGRDERGRTPLHLVLERRSTGAVTSPGGITLRHAPKDIVHGLICGAPRAAGVPDCDNTYPLHVAILNGHSVETILMLLDCYSGAVAEMNKMGDTPLLLAVNFSVVHRHHKNVKFDKDTKGFSSNGNLQHGENGADLTTTASNDKNDGKALDANQVAFEKKKQQRWDIVRRLLSSHRSAASIPNRHGITVLEMCIQRCAPDDIIRSLIRSYRDGTKIMRWEHPIANKDGSRSNRGRGGCHTPLGLAVARGCSLETLRMIAGAHPPAVKARDERGIGPIAALWLDWYYIRKPNSVAAPSIRAIPTPKEQQQESDNDSGYSFVRNPTRRKMLKKMHESKGMCIDAELVTLYAKIETLLMASAYPNPSFSVNDTNPLSPPPGQTFRVVHAAAGEDCPVEVLNFALLLKPNQVYETDENGRLPLHIAAEATLYRKQSFEPNLSKPIDTLINLYPEAVCKMDKQKRLPLHIAILSGKKWNDGMETIVRWERRALRVREPDTGLYPFMLMSVVASRAGGDINPVLQYLARKNFSVKEWQGMTAWQRNNEVRSIRHDNEMTDLTTVYLLLQSNPDVVECGIVHTILLDGEGTRSVGMADPEKEYLRTKNNELRVMSARLAKQNLQLVDALKKSLMQRNMAMQQVEQYQHIYGGNGLQMLENGQPGGGASDENAGMNWNPFNTTTFNDLDEQKQQLRDMLDTNALKEEDDDVGNSTATIATTPSPAVIANTAPAAPASVVQHAAAPATIQSINPPTEPAQEPYNAVIQNTLSWEKESTHQNPFLQFQPNGCGAADIASNTHLQLEWNHPKPSPTNEQLSHDPQHHQQQRPTYLRTVSCANVHNNNCPTKINNTLPLSQQPPPPSHHGKTASLSSIMEPQQQQQHSPNNISQHQPQVMFCNPSDRMMAQSASSPPTAETTNTTTLNHAQKTSPTSSSAICLQHQQQYQQAQPQAQQPVINMASSSPQPPHQQTTSSAVAPATTQSSMSVNQHGNSPASPDNNAFDAFASLSLMGNTNTNVSSPTIKIEQHDITYESQTDTKITIQSHQNHNNGTQTPIMKNTSSFLSQASAPLPPPQKSAPSPNIFSSPATTLNNQPSIQTSNSNNATTPQSRFQKGMKVQYTKTILSDDGSSSSTTTVAAANILNVHFDDELQPYYTILLPNGIEKQTDDAHLSLIDGGDGVVIQEEEEKILGSDR